MKAVNFIFIVVLFFMGDIVQAQAGSTVDIDQANKWVESHVWAKDLKIKPDPSINAVEFEKQYKSNKELWDKAFAFLSDSKLATLAPGKYAIDGDEVYAIIADNEPKKPEDAKWESHRKYLDIQYVIAGKVKLGVAPIESAKVTEPYDETKDAAHYTADGKYLIATPDEFFLFFPQDVHRPDIKIDGYSTLKKLVIKVRYKE